MRVLSWLVVLPFVASCSFCETPLVCVSDANCPAPQTCVDEVCAIAPVVDAGPSEGEGEGEASEGEGEASEGEGEASEGEGEASEGEGEGGEGEGEPVDAGPDCGAPTFCQAALCDGLVDANGRATLNISGTNTTSFCFEHEAEVWTLVAKVDGDDSDLFFSSNDQMGWNAVLRNADEASPNRDFGDGENALLHGYEGIEATELLVGFNSLSVDADGVPPDLFIPVTVPGAPRDLRDLVLNGASYPADAIEIALWRAAIGDPESGEVPPDFTNATNACVAFGRLIGGFGVRIGLLDDCDAPTAYIGLGGQGCDTPPFPANVDVDGSNEPTAGACDFHAGAGGESNIVVRAGYVLAR